MARPMTELFAKRMGQAKLLPAVKRIGVEYASNNGVE